ncbi:3-oxoacyl-ACP synthase [Micromonospora sp. LOL_024]|uniref:3-oxoacyl-ACP synthase n=1 Tax=Micromonospora sp. LOL_024 TaxID=3345412 RepID=UPI003A8699B4
MTVHLSATRYVLGEIEVPHTEVPDFAKRTREYRMPAQAELWGWGTVRRTRRTVGELAVDSGRRTLRAAGVDPTGVDALVLCCTRFPGGPDTHGAFVAEVMAGLGMPTAAFTGVTLNRCTNFLAGIDLATALVGSGRYRTVLVVTTDAVDDERDRFEQFALFSDGAASCLVGADAHGGPAYQVLGCASAQANADLDWSHEISSDLSRAVNDELAKVTGVAVGQVTGLLHANLFLPLVGMKERQAGFRADQLDTANVARVGHCFAADPLINLTDRAERHRVADGDTYLLAVSVPGARHGVLVRAHTTTTS